MTLRRRRVQARARTSRSTRATRSAPSSPAPNGVTLFEVMMGDPRSFPADEEAVGEAARGQGRDAGAEPADRAPRLARGHAHLRRRSDSAVRAGVGLAAAVPAQRPRRGGDRRRAARHRPRLAVEHGFDGVMTERAPRRVPRLPAEPAAGRGLVPRGDGRRAGRRRCPSAPAAAPARARGRGDRVARGALSRAGSGVGVASGALPDDFEIMHAPMDDLATRFHGRLRGAGRDARRPRPAASSPTIRRSPRARRAPDPGAERGDGLHRGARARRASARGSCSTRCRRPNGAASSSTRTARPAAPAPAILIRRAWVGEPPREQFDAPARRVPQLLQRTRPSSTGSGDEIRRRADAGRGRRRAGRGRCTAPAPTRCNLRVHVPGVDTRAAPVSRSPAWATRCCPASAPALGSDPRRR